MQANQSAAFRIPEVKFLQVSAAASMSDGLNPASSTCKADMLQYEQAEHQVARKYV